MKNNKHLILSLYLLTALIFILGAGERFLFIQNILKHPTLSFNLPQTDQFNYHVMAEDQLQNHSPDLKMTVYPVYLEFIKTVYRLFGIHISYIFYFQLFLSLLSVFMLFLIGKWLFNPFTGLFSAFLLLFYKMNFQYDAELLPTSLSQFFILSSLFFYIGHRKQNSLFTFSFFLISSLFLGLFRPFMWLILLPATGFEFIRLKLWKSPAYVFILVLWTLLSSVFFQRFHTPESFLHKFGMMFYMANLEKSSGMFTSLPGIPLNAEGHVKNSLFMASKISKTNEGLHLFWLNKALSDIVSHPFSFIQLNLKKLLLLFNQHEIHNNTSIYFLEKQTVLGTLFTISFPVLFAGAISGILLCLRQKQQIPLILIFIFLVLMILTMPLCSRYRLPLIPFLALFSGYSFSVILKEILSRKVFSTFALLIMFSVFYVFSFIPIKALNKEKDTLYWENIEARKTKHLETLTICRDDLSPQKTSSIENRVNALIQLGRLHSYRDFLAGYQKIIKQPLSDILKIRLQKQYAFLLETIFQFRMAKEVWKNLSEFQKLKSLCIKKEEELSVYEKYLS